MPVVMPKMIQTMISTPIKPASTPSKTLSQKWLSASFAAGIALTVIAAKPAVAADLYSQEPPLTQGSAYDDPRYADLYGHAPQRRVETYRNDSYRDYEPRGPIPSAPVYRDGERYAERDRPNCPSKAEISRHLEREGWRDFHNPQILGRDTATIDAQRPNGRPFRLEVDRCTGEILSERPIDRPRYGADRDGYGSYAEFERRPQRSY